MQLNKILKGLLISLPILAVTACSSSGNGTTQGKSQTNTPDTVVTPVDANGKLSEQELERQKQEALRENSTVYFAFDNSTVSGEYQDMLAAHAAFLSKNASAKVTVEGHADERGTPEYNIALGERRAEAVSKYLQALGVDATQISIMSYGEEKPLVMGQSEQAYAKNRRAVIVY